MTNAAQPNASATLQEMLRAFATQFDRQFELLLKPTGDVPQELIDAVCYSALAPGKRIRPFLVVRCCELVGGHRDDAWSVAAAVECIHAFSLIHDDLPAMDDDDLRRGQPTCHKKFDEATAILAGDALVVYAFELIARQVIDPAKANRMVLELAQATGGSGMIGGQAADILSESKPTSAELVRYIHLRKTASLFAVACKLGAMVGGGDIKSVDDLGRYGLRLGLLFQMADDLLDVTASTSQMGKPVGQDEQARKQTYPRCIGIEQSREALQQELLGALEELRSFGDQANDVRELARFIADRNY